MSALGKLWLLRKKYRGKSVMCPVGGCHSQMLFKELNSHMSTKHCIKPRLKCVYCNGRYGWKKGEAQSNLTVIQHRIKCLSCFLKVKDQNMTLEDVSDVETDSSEDDMIVSSTSTLEEPFKSKMIPLDLHRDAMIESYKKWDFMAFTEALIQVSIALLQVQHPMGMRAMPPFARIDIKKKLEAMFPNSRNDMEMSHLYRFVLDPSLQEVELWSRRHNTTGIMAIYKEKLIPRVYDLVRAEWPFRVSTTDFCHLGELLLTCLYHNPCWSSDYYKLPTECAICFDKCFVTRWNTHCHHEYHPECLEIWLADNNTCPLCRQTVIC